MSDVTVRMPKALRDRLEALSTETRRSKCFLGIKQAQAELKAGLGISHADLVKRSKAYLDTVKARRS